VAFLYEVIEISDAIRHCVHNFPRRKSGEFTAASTDSLWGLCAAAHASLMSQLESYQKALFAGLFEASRLNDEFKFELFERQLSKWNASIQLERLQNYRGDMASIGLVLADSLNGWHDPARVNSYFRAIVTSWDLFSTEDTSELAVLWQIRHSIVHTGGRLTRGDSHKVPELAHFADRALTIDHTFIDAVCRRFHSMAKRTVGGLEAEFRRGVTTTLSDEETAELDALFRVQSSRPSWLK